MLSGMRRNDELRDESECLPQTRRHVKDLAEICRSRGRSEEPYGTEQKQ